MNNKYAAYINKLKAQQSTTSTIFIICCCLSSLLFIGLGLFGYKQKDFILDIVNKIQKEDKDEKEDKKEDKKDDKKDESSDKEESQEDNSQEEQIINACDVDEKQSDSCNYNECKNNKCICKGNYSGDNCEVDLCEYNNEQLNCVNGRCVKGSCVCNEGWALLTDRDRNSPSYGKKICTKDLCEGTGVNRDNKCGQNDNPPRGVCNIDGTCECSEDWFGGVCEQNNCMIRKNNKFVNKCFGVDQGITSCSNITGKCVCNCSTIDNNGNCLQNLDTTYSGPLCNNNLCETNDKRPKCGIGGTCLKTGSDGISCQCKEGYTPSTCPGQNEQCCNTYECQGCIHGACKEVKTASKEYSYYDENTESVKVEIKSMGQYYCECEGSWMGRNCDINNCLVKEGNQYKINPLTNNYVKKCDPDNVNRSKCILNPLTKEFKECECINNWSKVANASPDTDCLVCLGGGDGYICPSNDCPLKSQYKDKVDGICKTKQCILPEGCRIAAKGNDTNTINGVVYPEYTKCRIHNTEQCAINQCKDGYYYVDKIEVTNEHFTTDTTSNPPTSNPPTSNPPTSSSGSTPNPIISHSINTKEFKYGVCLENKCSCPNGKPTTGINCPTHNQLSCKKDSICNQGYYKYYESEADRVINNYKCVSENECLMNRTVDRTSKINDLSYPDYLFTLDEINTWKEANPSNSNNRSNQNHKYSPNFIRNGIECVNKKRDNSS